MGSRVNEQNDLGEFFFIIGEQQNCHVEGFDLPLHLPLLFLLSTQPLSDPLPRCLEEVG
jgi:hypothetical protein